MNSLERRIKTLENYHKAVVDEQDIIFIEDSGLEITGFTLCHAAAGGELVERFPGETLEDLQSRCRDLDRNFRRENPLQRIQAPSVAFADYDLKRRIEG